MDLLASLAITSLPEQQTRLENGHPKVVEALYRNPRVRLGFDSCCTCGRTLLPRSFSDYAEGECSWTQRLSTPVACRQCHRVRYCSNICRTQDSNPELCHSTSISNVASENSPSGGHSDIVCKLLRLCNVDDEVDDRCNKPNPDDETVLKCDELNVKEYKRKTCHTGVEQDNKNNFTSAEIQAAEDRARSEYDSYPATLANIASYGSTSIFQSIWIQKMRSLGFRSEGHQCKLIIHIIGASDDAEICQYKPQQSGVADQATSWHDAYMEAVVNIEKSFAHEGHHLSSIHLVFIGPQLRSQLEKKTMKIGIKLGSSCDHCNSENNNEPSSSCCAVILECHSTTYEQYIKSLPLISSSDEEITEGKEFVVDMNVAMFFNPGFTCADYMWEDALDEVNKKCDAFVVTSNTEMEAILDCQYLYNNECILSLPLPVQQMLAIENSVTVDVQHNSSYATSSRSVFLRHENSCGNDDEAGDGSFFGENPFCGRRVRQSGNMGNDLFVKNRWIFGGVSQSLANPIAAELRVGQYKGLKKERHQRRRKYRNSKRGNPRLI